MKEFKKDMNFYAENYNFFEPNEQDLKDFKTLEYIFFENREEPYITGREISHITKWNPAHTRQIIANWRRTPRDDGNFIIANSKGYEMVIGNSPELEKYFQKTQKRWQRTFGEIYNLMKIKNNSNF